MASPLPTWPPELSESQLESLTLLATTYALSHGLLYLPPSPSPPPAPTSAIHAPITLFPTPFPRRLFLEAQRLQRVYNLLYARVAMDVAFLDRVMGEDEGVADVDDFVRQLWRGWKQVRDQDNVQTLQLGLFRSDYLLHEDPDTHELCLKQVEFNTISSSFAPLSHLAAGMHRYLLASTDYYNASQTLRSINLPPNDSLASLVQGLAEAHNAYGSKDAQILFVVQDGERNVFDQRWLEYELLAKHSIRVVRQSLHALAASAALTPARALALTLPTHAAPVEIAVVYYRAGYTPADYPTPRHYATRTALERSRAIQCPSLALQLAGAKAVQAALARPGAAEAFLLDPARGPERVPPADVAALRAGWMPMWPLDDNDGGDGGDGAARARAAAPRLVLKPQREGGGNNVYPAAVPAFLAALAPAARRAWVAMALIAPPARVANWLVRADAGAPRVRRDVVSELGVYGWALFRGGGGGGGAVLCEREAGWLVRTKGRESDEGGVAVGVSVLDSVVLVD